MGHRINNVYMISLDDISLNDAQCFITKEEESWLWHKRIAHIHMDHLYKIISKEFVIGLPKIRFEKDKLCDAWVNKQKSLFNLKVSFQPLDPCNYCTWTYLVHQEL